LQLEIRQIPFAVQWGVDDPAGLDDVDDDPLAFLEIVRQNDLELPLRICFINLAAGSGSSLLSDARIPAIAFSNCPQSIPLVAVSAGGSAVSSIRQGMTVFLRASAVVHSNSTK